ncbi:ParA family protein [Streptomyces sp. NRRL S-350]|uniref:ParA family protein n=1 Tax=Streptomyces sp. NRRL S-350 TaxID=1463902 RepID=UPI00068E0BA5|nr:AAA family ATPase [Streptomyces sp. NRRL S-350]
MSTKLLPMQEIRKRLRPNDRLHPLIIAFLLAAGGTAKTTSTVAIACILALRGYKVVVFDLDAQSNASETLCQGEEQRKPGSKTVWDLINKRATLEETLLPGRFRVALGTSEDCFREIPNLYVVPGDPELIDADTIFATQRQKFYWFADLTAAYEDGKLTADDNEIWLLDLPANYQGVTVTSMIAMEEEDEVIPPLLVTGKEAGALKKLYKALEKMRDDNVGRGAPANPTVHNILLCATPTPSHSAKEYHETVEKVELDNPGKILPYVRYSGVAAAQYSKQCPVSISADSSAPALDYEAVVDALGFPDLEPGE